MPKPIFIISFGRLPNSIEDKLEITDTFVSVLGADYHVLLTFEDNTEDPYVKFKLFSDKEIEPIELEKLKQIVNGTT